MFALPLTAAFPVGLLLLIVGAALALVFKRRWPGLLVGGLGLLMMAGAAMVVVLMAMNPM